MIKVLFVDDDLGQVQGDIDLLDNENFSKITVTNGYSAIEKIKTENDPEITVVVSDVRMPGLTGIELTKQVYKINRFLPVILLTQYGPEYMKEAIEAGAFWYLVKNNYSFEELVALINRAHIFYTYQRLKDNFVHSLSHVTRTPLNAIKNSSELLDINNREEFGTLLDIIKSECTNIQKTLTNLFDYSDINSGGYKIKKTKIDLKETLIRIIAQFRCVENEKKLSIQFYSNISNPILVADEYSIGRLFYELLDNALKFTSQGIIKIDLRSEMNSLVVNVTDSGIGIQPYAQGNIFEEFYQAEIGTIRNNLGYGLGLTVASEFAKLNKARILCASSLGKGSKFSVIFTQ